MEDKRLEALTSYQQEQQKRRALKKKKPVFKTGIVTHSTGSPYGVDIIKAKLGGMITRSMAPANVKSKKKLTVPATPKGMSQQKKIIKKHPPCLSSTTGSSAAFPIASGTSGNVKPTVQKYVLGALEKPVIPEDNEKKGKENSGQIKMQTEEQGSSQASLRRRGVRVPRRVLVVKK